MNGYALREQLTRRFGQISDNTIVLAAFTGTLFLSAFLLFSIQPMFAKMVLPKLGGSPSVWAVSMCFFQAVLLGGYLYAYALNHYVAPRYAPFIHLGLLAIALVALPVGLPQVWSEPSTGNTYVWLTGLLAVGVGLPFFAVSANAPLLQAWFSRSGHPHAADPYFLYGASNLGSLIALLSYPVFFEPVFGLANQSQIWTTGFVLLGLAIAACAVILMVRDNANGRSGAAVKVSSSKTAPAQKISIRQRGTWIMLAFVPSGLLVAFTSFVSTDIAAAPFLWVIPLAIFLGTFILVFRDRPLLSHNAMLRIQPMLVAMVFLGITMIGDMGWMIAVIAGFAAFFVTTMVCHKQLYDRRPDASRLTEFYLWMSFGGVLGGIFAAIIAPQVFNSIYEYPILLLAGIALRPGAVSLKLGRIETRNILAGFAIGLAIVALIFVITSPAIGAPANPLRYGLLIVLAFLAVHYAERSARQLAVLSVALAVVLILPSPMNGGNSERSFFGVHRIRDNGAVRLLVHGTTVHGAQRLRDAQGKLIADPTPATYYYPASPMAKGLEAARIATPNSDKGLRVGIVGLGAGAMACHARSNEQWKFFEIDPVVVSIATDPKKFTYMSRCQPGADITVGDARLTVAKLPSSSLDYLLIDAFTSDTVPVHLLTVEALKMYLDKLSPNGILAMHISNRHLELASVAGAAVKAIPGTLGAYAVDNVKSPTMDEVPSKVIFITKNEAAMAPIRELAYVGDLESGDVTAWSDDYSNIVAAILRKKFGK